MKSALIPMRYILFLVLVILSSCSSRMQNYIQPDDLQPKLSAAIEKKRQNNQPVVIQIKSFTDFEWDKFYVFNPYTSAEEVRETLGFDTTLASHSRIKDNDSHNLLVFVRDDQVAAFIDYPRVEGDFDKLKRRSGYSPAEAVFEVKAEGKNVYGGEWLRLYPKVAP